MMKVNSIPENSLRGTWIGVTGAIFGLLAVALGAFGAHGLRGRLPPGDMAIFEVAVRYQMYHALGLVLVAVLTALAPGFRGRGVGWAFTLGVLIFSGSLYALVLTGQRWLGALTPLGGVAFLVGWGALAWSFIRREHA
jgi:uncharacterized membrane protein YgdD (TMEM256/DUF423 family)